MELVSQLVSQLFI